VVSDKDSRQQNIKEKKEKMKKIVSRTHRASKSLIEANEEKRVPYP
jgi:hypothetical protein